MVSGDCCLFVQEICWGPEHRHCSWSRSGAQTALLSIQNVLLELARGFYLIWLSLLKINPRYDGLSLQQLASSVHRPRGTAPIRSAWNTGLLQVTDPPFFLTEMGGKTGRHSREGSSHGAGGVAGSAQRPARQLRSPGVRLFCRDKPKS